MAHSGTRHRYSALTIGLVATVVGGTVYALGLLDRLNGFNLDLHFRHFNTIEADPRIVLIDIDDSTFSNMPNWPWPRRVHADLVHTLHELGANAIVLDIIFSEPSSPRTEHAGLSRHYDIDNTLTQLGDRAFDEVIYDDDELRDAIAGAGNVYLAMYARVRVPDHSSSAGHEDCRIEGYDGGARYAAARFLLQQPQGSWPEFFQAVLPDHSFDAQSPERQTFLSAFRQEDAIRTLRNSLPNIPESLTGRTARAVDLTPPNEKFAKAARGVGLVSLARDDSQAVVRSLPLMAEEEGKLWPQLGLRVALDVLGISPSLIPDSTGACFVGDPSHRRRIPTDPTGATLVNWYRPRRGEDWRDAFRHLPAAWLLEITLNREAIADNARRLALAIAELVQTRHVDTPSTYVDYVQLVNERLQLARSENPDATRLNNINESIKRIEDEALAWLSRAWGLWREATPEGKEEGAERDGIKRLYDRFGEGQYAALLDRANAKMTARNQQLLDDLRPKLQDKICLVGYTATAMADMVPTPVDPAMPGVMVHANVINMFLQNRFAAEASRGVGLAILFLAGLVTTLTSSLRSTRFSVLSLLVIASAMLGLGAAFFWLRTYHIPSVVAVVVVVFVWASVTVYRQATEERARRAFQRALAQYTSPAVAARIAERTHASDLAPQLAFVSCFFSDLADFTRLSERLGPQATRRLLEPYLGGVSAALLDHGAMVNKFMGDGVFAFFNAPILPCPDHARAACEGALVSLAAVTRCNSERQAETTSLLRVRIGLSTGEAFVGDYGSDMKLDYTCIGDTVNLGSRLERANKVFGTAILIDDATRKAAGESYLFRSLGLIEVVGRAAGVCVHELVGKDGDVEEAMRRYIETFGKAIGCFQHCEWDSCLALFAECRKLRPDDRAVGIYEQAVALRRNALCEATQGSAIQIGEL